jgi:hypothetical protein
MTSNKAEVTLDLANRSIITRLKKAGSAIEIPGVKGTVDPQKICMHAGTLLRRLFRDQDTQVVADIAVTHSIEKFYDSDNRKFRDKNIYSLRHDFAPNNGLRLTAPNDQNV